MVDTDDLPISGGGGGGSSSSSSSSSSSGSSSSGSSNVGADSGTFSLDGDEIVDPGDKSVSKTSEEWANDKGDLNYDTQGNESLESYMKRQVEEVDELHDNIRDMAKDHNDNFQEFTLYMHTLLLNFAQNRVGIMKTIQNQYGKSDREAFKLTNKICKRAGEDQMMEDMVRDITKNLADM